MTKAIQGRSVDEQLRDTPTVRDTILAAASAARGIPGADPYAMTHSWVFSGPPGSGRSVAARAFAQALVCQTEGALGCGRCQACRDVAADAHTDVERIVPEGNVISVSVVREKIIPTAHSLPTVAQWRVVIIEDADRLGAEAANALLKTIEEPPARTVIILCVPSLAPEDFLPTLRSRCRHLYIPSPSTQRVVDLLVAEGFDERDARLAATSTLHHIGRARRLVSMPIMQNRRAQAIELADLIFHGDAAFKAVNGLISTTKKEIAETYDELDERELHKLEEALGVGAKGKGTQKSVRGSAGAINDLKKEQKRRRTRAQTDILDLALVDLAGVYRDAMMIAAGLEPGRGLELTHPDFEPLARKLAEAAGGNLATFVAAHDAIRECRERLTKFASPQLAIDGMMGRLRLAFHAS